MMDTPDPPLDLAADFKSYQERITSALVNVIRSSSQIGSEDLGFHRSSNEKVSKTLDTQSTHLLRLTNKLLKAATKDSNIKPPSIQDRDGVDDNWRKVVDVVDDLLEKADASLDEFNGVIKRLSPARQERQDRTEKVDKMNNSVTPVSKSKPQPVYSPWSSANMPKPQLLFDRKVNNYETGHWKPLLETKPHALVPLDESIGTGGEGYNHPYRHEIENYQYPASTYEEKLPIPFTQPQKSEPIFIDDEEGLRAMLNELKLANEIAVDLEHNDRNSYVGLVSLMQISTRNKDWIVDTLKPWRENLQVLNEVFADPQIVKVFHGSTMDMIWLQRDLGLYVVGLFDTFWACTALNFPAKSLAYLLQKYAYFTAQKQYQTADWRVRPLPQELLDYARSDTHFLLYIFDAMRNELVKNSTPQNNLIDFVLENSKKEALQTYERPVYDHENGLGPIGWLKMILSHNSRWLTNEQFGVLRAVHEWRDQAAREADDGEQTIMPNAFLWNCAETMPMNRFDLFNKYLGKVPRYVAQHYEGLITAIKKGRDEGRNGPAMHDVIQRNATKLGKIKDIRNARNQKPQDINRSIAATMQQLARAGEIPDKPGNSTTSTSVAAPEPAVDDGVTAEAIASRGTTSTFWGSVPPVSNIDTFAINMAAATQALSYMMPFQNFATPSFPTSATGTAPPPLHNSSLIAAIPSAATRPVHETIEHHRLPSTVGDDVFILNDRQKKRNAEEAFEEGEVEVTNGHQPQTSAITEGSASYQNLNPAAAKKAKKAAKKAQKEAAQAEKDAADKGTVPFDYNTADSILHARPEAVEQAKDGKSKPFNPYAKALDTGTGARRNKMGKEIPGLSYTFKS